MVGTQDAIKVNVVAGDVPRRVARGEEALGHIRRDDWFDRWNGTSTLGATAPAIIALSVLVSFGAERRARLQASRQSQFPLFRKHAAGRLRPYPPKSKRQVGSGNLCAPS
jgi:hypothetical protein